MEFKVCTVHWASIAKLILCTCFSAYLERFFVFCSLLVLCSLLFVVNLVKYTVTRIYTIPRKVSKVGTVSDTCIIFYVFIFCVIHFSQQYKITFHLLVLQMNCVDLHFLHCYNSLFTKNV